MHALREGEKAMLSRFCRYIEKVYDFGQRARALRDARPGAWRR